MNPLNELLPPKARLALYVLVAFAGAVLAAWQAAEGNWTAFAVGVIQFLSSSLAAGNVTTRPPAEPTLPEIAKYPIPEED